MSTETIAPSPVTAPSYPCTCRPGCGQTMGTPGGEGHGWALACYKRWQRAGRPPGGPPAPLPVGRQTRAYVTREEGRQLMAGLARLRGDGLTIAQAAAVLGISASAAGHYANRQLELDREAALSSVISWPRPAPPVPGATHWGDRAACRGHGGLFHGPDGERSPERVVREAKARSLCAVCPVRRDCLEEALGRHDWHGVHGGMTEDEKRSEHRRRVRLVREAAA